jgi:hypothetical protein
MRYSEGHMRAQVVAQGCSAMNEISQHLTHPIIEEQVINDEFINGQQQFL